MDYTYTIYDGNPADSGPCAWPEYRDVEIEATGPDDALAQALSVAESEGRACGQYNPGDRLWVIVRDDDGINVAQDDLTL